MEMEPRTRPRISMAAQDEARMMEMPGLMAAWPLSMAMSTAMSMPLTNIPSGRSWQYPGLETGFLVGVLVYLLLSPPPSVISVLLWVSLSAWPNEKQNSRL